ncbi:hypothetical protein D3C81_1295850 [compost metagenome]
MVPVASNTAVITSASTLGSTAADSAPRMSMAPISEAWPGAERLGRANTPVYFTAGSKARPSAEMAMITSRMPPGTRRRSRPKIAASPSTDITTGKAVMWPSCTGRPAPGFLTTRPTSFEAISNRKSPIPIPAPWATPAGRLRKIQDRTPVTEIAVKTTPIRNTAPSATSGESFCPSTRPKAMKAVSEMAQPMAMGSRAQSPISSEPNAVVRHTATNTALVSKPALPSMPGTTNTA